MSKHDLRKIRTRILLEDALFQLLKKKALRDIQITELAEKAMISRKTFYTHYQVIEELYADCFKHLMEEIRENYENLKLDKENCSTREMLYNSFSILYKNMDKLRILIQIENKDLIINSLSTIIQDYIDIVLPELEFNGEEHSVSNTMFKRFLAGGFYTLYTDWLVGDIVLDPEEFTDLFIEIVYRLGTHPVDQEI